MFSLVLCNIQNAIVLWDHVYQNQGTVISWFLYFMLSLVLCNIQNAIVLSVHVYQYQGYNNIACSLFNIFFSFQ